MKYPNPAKLAHLEKVGFRMGEFARACGFSRSTLYALPEDQQPQSIKIGRARVIIETPAAFLQRLAQMQRVAT